MDQLFFSSFTDRRYNYKRMKHNLFIPVENILKSLIFLIITVVLPNTVKAQTLDSIDAELRLLESQYTSAVDAGNLKEISKTGEELKLYFKKNHFQERIIDSIYLFKIDFQLSTVYSSFTHQNTEKIIDIGSTWENCYICKSKKLSNVYLMLYSNYIEAHLTENNFEWLKNNIYSGYDLLDYCSEDYFPEGYWSLVKLEAKYYDKTGRYDSSIELLKNFISILDKNNLEEKYKGLLVQAHYTLSKVYFEHTQNNEFGLNHLNRSYAYLKEIKQKTPESEIVYHYFDILNSELYQKNLEAKRYQTALNYNQQSIEYFKIKEDIPLLVNKYTEAAILYSQMGQRDSTYKFIDTVNMIVDNNKEVLYLPSIYWGLSLVVSGFDVQERINYLNIALNEIEKDTITSYNHNTMELMNSIRLSLITALLAQDELAKKDVNQALAIALEAVDGAGNYYGSDSKQYIDALSQLGFVYDTRGEYDHSLRTYEYLYKNHFGGLINNLYSKVELLKAYSYSLFKNSRTEEGIKFALKANLLERSIFKQKQFLNFETSISDKNSGLLNFVRLLTEFEDLKKSDSMHIAAYENIQLVKKSHLNYKKKLAHTGGSQFKTEYIQNQLDQYLNGSVDFEENDYLLEDTLYNFLPEYKEYIDNLQSDFHTIRNMLSEDEVVIEIGQMNRVYDFENKSWSNWYYAFIVSREFNRPKFIELCFEKEIQEVLNYYGGRGIEKAYSSLEEGHLYELLLRKLLPEINGSSRVYISASGILNIVNFGAISLDNKNKLSDITEVRNVDNTANIKELKAENNRLKTPLFLFGGIDYGSFGDESDLIDNNSESRSIDKWSALAGTLSEVREIDSVFKQNKYKSKLILGKNATEQSLRSLTEQPEPFILHIATHGYSVQNKHSDNLNGPMNNAETSFVPPLYKSGIILANSNIHSKSNFNADNLSNTDGILTAAEISSMDLTTCELIVLSACETGLGEIQGGEGIFGVQRAFKIAGVNKTLVSLWEVPDKETKELFILFYQSLLENKSSSEALKIAQQTMAKKYDNLYFWAAFILIE